MNPKARRIVFPLLAAAGATIVFLLVVTSGKRPTDAQVEQAATEAQTAATSDAASTTTDATQAVAADAGTMPSEGATAADGAKSFG